MHQQAIDPQFFTAVISAAGILISILIALIGVIWKTSQREIGALRQISAELTRQVDGLRDRIIVIEGKCDSHAKTEMDEGRMRKILGEELSQAMTTFSKTFTLDLIQKGYIKPPTSKRQKTNP